MRTIKVCLQDSATDDEVDTLIAWLQGVRCTGAVYEVKENAAQQSVQADYLPCGHPKEAALQMEFGSWSCQMCKAANSR